MSNKPDKITCWDSETTGFFTTKKPWNHPDQPRILSLGAVQFNGDYQEQASVYSIIRPEWPAHKLPQQAVDVHGISYERAMDEGRPWNEVWAELFPLFQDSDMVLGFNEQYDRTLLNIESSTRYGHMSYLEYHFHPLKIRCLMQLMAPMMKMRKKNCGPWADYKWPKLTEAYEWLFHEPMTGAHNSMMDARCTGEIAYGLISTGLWDGISHH